MIIQGQWTSEQLLWNQTHHQSITSIRALLCTHSCGLMGERGTGPGSAYSVNTARINNSPLNRSVKCFRPHEVREGNLRTKAVNKNEHLSCAGSNWTDSLVWETSLDTSTALYNTNNSIFLHEFKDSNRVCISKCIFPFGLWSTRSWHEDVKTSACPPWRHHTGACFISATVSLLLNWLNCRLRSLQEFSSIWEKSHSDETESLFSACFGPSGSDSSVTVQQPGAEI